MTTPLRRWLSGIVLLVVAASGTACKQSEGAPCERSADCKSGLKCVEWDEDFEKVVGDCDDEECCAGKKARKKAEKRHEKREARKKAKLEKEGRATGTKIAQCNRLIKVINDEQGPLKNATGSSPEALEKLAETLESVNKRVVAVELDDPKLVGFRNAYATMALDLAVASRSTAAALRSSDPAKAAEAAKRMSGFGPRETKLVDDINKHCSSS